MIEGFAVIDADVGWHPSDPKGWEIVGVEYGLEPEFTRRLEVTLQRGRGGERARVLISGATSFRLQHERDMVSYWAQAHKEGVPSGMFYTVRKSGYLDDLSHGGVSAAAKPQTHYLLSADADCVEFVGPAWGSKLSIEVVRTG